ncbi:MAG: hypothetical protein HKN79_09545, partial [Flavobacteriales bacterium]|nr:hypothetical protein [Flavobacteriales bacterium]
MRTLIYSNLFIALCAAILTLGTYGIIDHPPDVFLVLHVFGVTLMAYNVQRLARLEKFSNRTDQIRWYLRNKWMLYTSLLIGLLLAGITLFFLPIRILLYFSPLAVVSVFYSIPFNKGRTIRAIPGIKIFLITGVWTGVTLALPLVMAGQSIGEREILLMIQRFFFILAITIPFDMRDLKYDEEHMRTIPQTLGHVRSKQLAVALALSCVLIELLMIVWAESLSLDRQAYLNIAFYLLVAGLISGVKKDSPDSYFT